MVGYCGAQQKNLTLNTTKAKQLYKFQEGQSSSVCTSLHSSVPYCITVWYAGRQKGSSEGNKCRTKKIVGCPLPSLEDIANTCYLSRAKNVVKDCSHPGHHLFDLLPSGRFNRSLKTGTTGLMNSFFPKTIHTLNQLKHAK